MNFTFQRLTPENIYWLQELHKAEYGQNVSLSYLMQKYSAGHLCNRMYGYLAMYNNKAVAVTAAIPYLLQYNGIVELTAQEADTITLQQFRGKGLFTTLSKLLHDDLVRDGFSCVWTFPSKKGEVIYHKLNWQQVSSINGYCIPVAGRYVAYARRQINALVYGNMATQHFFKQILSAEKPVPSFAGNQYVSVCRNDGHYRYKDFGGSFCITVNGKRIWLKQVGSLNIGELDPLTTSEVIPLVNELKKYALKAGAQNIYFQTSAGSVNDIAFSQHFEKFDSWKLGCYNFNSQFPLDKLRVTWADLDTF